MKRPERCKGAYREWSSFSTGVGKTIPEGDKGWPVRKITNLIDDDDVEVMQYRGWCHCRNGSQERRMPLKLCLLRCGRDDKYPRRLCVEALRHAYYRGRAYQTGAGRWILF